jgi:hypothetical protein
MVRFARDVLEVDAAYVNYTGFREMSGARVGNG